MSDKISSARSHVQVSVIVILTFFVLNNIYLGPVSWSIVRALAGEAPPLQRLSVAAAFHYIGPQFIVPLCVTAFILGRANMFEALGLGQTPWRGLGFAVLCTLPLPLTYAFTTPLQDISKIFIDVLNDAILAGFSEELLFRCFLFGLLFRFAKWKFLPAAMLGAIIFAIGHLYQGNAILDSASVFAITLAAALWWAWLYVKWNYNAWVPIGFHVLMNGWFNVFSVSETALLPIAAEIARVSVVVISIILTMGLNRQNEGQEITGR